MPEFAGQITVSLSKVNCNRVFGIAASRRVTSVINVDVPRGWRGVAKPAYERRLQPKIRTSPEYSRSLNSPR